MKNPYINIPGTIWLLSTVSLIRSSGSMVLVFLPLYLTQMLHFDIITAGQIVSLYGLGEIIGSYLGGMVTDKIGSLHVQIIAFFLVGVLYLVLEFLHLKLAIMAVMFLIGLFSAAGRPATGASIAKFAPEEMRARAYALNYQAVNLGCAMGPVLGGILAGINYMWLFRMDGLANIMAALAVWLFFRNRQSLPLKQEEATTYQSVSVWKDHFFLIFLILLLLIGICFFQIFNIYPFYLRNNYHLSEFQIGMVMGTNGIMIGLLQMPLTNALRNFNILRIIRTGGILISIGYFILPWYSGFHYALLSMMIITFGEMCTMPFAFDFATKIAGPEARGKYLGLLSCALTSVPLLLTPNLMPYLYTVLGPNKLWYCIGLIGVTIFIGFELLNTSQASFKLRKQAA